MSKRKSRIELAIEDLKAQRAVIDHAIATLEKQLPSPKPKDLHPRETVNTRGAA